jgi:hypothetical protein
MANQEVEAYFPMSQVLSEKGDPTMSKARAVKDTSTVAYPDEARTSRLLMILLSAGMCTTNLVPCALLTCCVASLLLDTLEEEINKLDRTSLGPKVRLQDPTPQLTARVWTGTRPLRLKIKRKKSSATVCTKPQLTSASRNCVRLSKIETRKKFASNRVAIS